MKYLRKFVTIILVVVLFFNVFSTEASAGSGQWIYNKGGWTVRLDCPDGTGKNKDKVPKSVMRSVMAQPKVKKAVSYHTPAINSAWVRSIVKPLLVAGAGVMVVVSAVNIFTGPIDDIAAWAALSAVLGM